MNIPDNTEFDRGPFITPQMLILFLVLIGGPLLFFIAGRFISEPEPSLYGKYQGDQSSNTDDTALPNRKDEVDSAVADVDFEKFDYQLQLETTMGTILIDLWPEVAPGHCKNMIGLARIGFYDGLLFHRVISGFMGQGGDPIGTGMGGPGYTIPAEFNDRKHVPGVLSMARGGDPDSAGSQFFICTAKRADLDGKYTVFGKTANQESLDVVMKFDEVKTGENDRPLEEIKILSMTVLEIPKTNK